MSTVDDLAWKIIRSCGLSTGNSDINVFALQEAIKEMLKPRELTDEEIWQIFQETQHHAMDFARAILKKASEK
jgi:hypothetical protein